MNVWTNLLLQSANVGDTGSPWSGNTGFTIASAPSIIPGQTAYRHTSDGAAIRSRIQTIGTFSAGAETYVGVLENVDALTSAVYLRDAGVANGMRVIYTWATGATNIDVSGAMSSVTAGAVDLGGGAVLLWVSGTPNNPGNTREAYVYPTGTGTNTDTAIIHYAGLFEAATYPPDYIVTENEPVTQVFGLLQAGSGRRKPGANISLSISL